MTTLEELRPRKKRTTMSVLDELGFDVSDWANYKRGSSWAAANPKYCYEWGFLNPGKLAVLNLWIQNTDISDGRVSQPNNFREDARFWKANGRGADWGKRAAKLDEIMRHAVEEQLPLRVIFLDGTMRDAQAANATTSKVTARDLDPEVWHVASYDFATGQHTVVRGDIEEEYMDQFDLPSNSNPPDKYETTSSTFKRDRAVRKLALKLARGKCRKCGMPGFKMPDGRRYLETHHIVPLSEGGIDHITNVIAICPNDHREAHFGLESDAMRVELLRIVRADSTLDS
ncbi:HNH endonuclease [uncultured Maricaulis sp.]|uniref:HNH endonuclease n=1 Tax=uncultured Maricaulis sp. TaxID=174710 RepID=UPI0030D8E54D|tara:strand:- start:2007 stop:2864 length:858 start_codon:yes stop_codon:yes gene_type:complete